MLCVGCSTKTMDLSFTGKWTGGYYADNINYGTWNITIDNKGSITGKLISAPAFQSYEFIVIGAVQPDGSISFTAFISPTIQWKFEGLLKGSVANGTWIAESIPGNPPNKIWKGDKQQ